MDYQEIIAGTVGKENTYGTIVGRVQGRALHLSAACPPTTCTAGCAPTSARAKLTNDPLQTFGGYGVVRVPHLQKLLRLHLRERLRAPRLHQPVAPGLGRRRSLWQVPGLAGLPPPMSELENVLSRIRGLLAERGLDALLLERVSSFAWATCGAASYINTAATNGDRLAAHHPHPPLPHHHQHRSAAPRARRRAGGPGLDLRD